MTLHCMIDMETWSTATNAVMISIGAVKYDPAAPQGEFVDEFHVGIDPTSYGNLIGGQLGFDINPATVKFWLDTERSAAREAWLALQKVTLTTALEGFAVWYVGPEADSGVDGVTHPERPDGVWSNGATFDIAILKRTYELVGMECPWHFRAENCYRTIYNLVGKSTVIPPFGLAHDGLSDAKWQADKLRIMFRALGLFSPAEA